MSLWKVAWRSIRQRSLVSTLTVVSMGLGVALVVAVLVVYGVVEQSFHRGGEGYDLIVGAKGGKEQLVLNTVFYLSQPVGNIPYTLLRGIDRGEVRPAWRRPFRFAWATPTRVSAWSAPCPRCSPN